MTDGVIEGELRLTMRVRLENSLGTTALVCRTTQEVLLPQKENFHEHLGPKAKHLRHDKRIVLY